MNNQHRHFTVVTAGHVDHGKSSLVKALTGTDPDRLPEEKARGITLELGFAHLELAAPDPPGTTLNLGIIDVPGHEDLVKTMVAGAGSVDLALFAVAADDGWMPQTEEHLQILAYLGVQRAIVVLTKVDVVTTEWQTHANALREKLRGSPFEHALIIPVSARTGTGLQELKAALWQALQDAPSPVDAGKPRLAIDRAFTLHGIGTVVTGSLRGGWLHSGQEVVVQPGANTTRIRSLQTFGHTIESAGPGMRTALCLADVQPTRKAHAGMEPVVERGQVVTLANLGQAHNCCEVLVERSARLTMDPLVSRPLRNGTRVRLHTGTSDVPGRLYLNGRTELNPGENCVAQLRLEAPIYAFVGDRFVLRDWPERITLAGGIILAPQEHPRRKLVLPFAIRDASPAASQFAPTSAPLLTPQLAIQLALQTQWALDAQGLLVQSIFTPSEISTALSQLSANGECKVRGALVVGAHTWQNLVHRAQTLIDQQHQSHPEQPGLSLAELRSALKLPATPSGIFESLVADLVSEDFAQIGSALKRKNHQPALPPALQSAAASIRTALSTKPLDPPSRAQLAPDQARREALSFLLRSGEAVELGPDLVLSARAFLDARKAVTDFLQSHGAAAVSELRQAVGASRRLVVPLLEKLDREGTTRRVGDKRCFNQAQSTGQTRLAPSSAAPITTQAT